MLKNIKDYVQDALDGQIVLTKFLDLEEIKEIKNINNHDLAVYFEGGYENAERVRAIIQLKIYEAPNFNDFKIKIYHATYERRFTTISHRNVLGSIMSLNIERNTFGDIYLFENHIYLFVTSEMAKYLINNMPYINNQMLTFTETKEVNTTHQVAEKIIEVNVASLRLDAVIARCLNISRNKASEIITSNLVAINHLPCTNLTYKCQLQDIISIRKFGRLTILEQVKTTRKDRLVIRVGVKH